MTLLRDFGRIFHTYVEKKAASAGPPGALISALVYMTDQIFKSTSKTVGVSSQVFLGEKSE